MKKTSVFLVAIMFFLAIAVVPAGIEKVQAFPYSDLSENEKTDRCKSLKAGSEIRFFFKFNEDGAISKEQLEGAQIGLCPQNSERLEDAVVLWNVEEGDIIISEQHSVVQKTEILQSDIPEGFYNEILFDEQGNQIVVRDLGYKVVNKAMASFGFSAMNNDGYVYAYVYENDLAEGQTMTESNYPTLYDSDQESVLTSYDAFTIHTNTSENERAGRVYVYRLNVLNADRLMVFDEEGLSCAYYKINGEFSPYEVNEIGMARTAILDLTVLADDYTIVSPFNQKDDSSNETPDTPSDDNNSDTTPDTPSTSGDTGNTSTATSAASTATSQTTAAPTEPEIAVMPLAGSTVPEVQASIDVLNKLVEEISSSPADVVSTLKAYAAGTDFSSVTAGGTLDISVTNGADISSGKQITFTDDKIAANVTSADQIVVLHVKNDGTIECVPATAGDGCITATFTSLSPVAWFKVSNAEKVTAASPKTGESFWSFIMH